MRHQTKAFQTTKTYALLCFGLLTLFVVSLEHLQAREIRMFSDMAVPQPGRTCQKETFRILWLVTKHLVRWSFLLGLSQDVWLLWLGLGATSVGSCGRFKTSTSVQLTCWKPDLHLQERVSALWHHPPSCCC